MNESTGSLSELERLKIDWFASLAIPFDHILISHEILVLTRVKMILERLFLHYFFSVCNSTEKFDF